MQFVTRASKCKLFSGLLLLSLGILSLIWTPFTLFMNERLNMRPELPMFKWWTDPPDGMFNVYIFNITNADRFLSGEDEKMHVDEVGPIIFRERCTHRDAVFNDNSTMSYTVNHTAIYEPDRNTIDLNATIVVPNMAVLVAASYLWDANVFTKVGFNYLITTLDSKTIVNTTVYNFLYNNTDRLLDVGNNYLPALVPMRNLGIVPMIYGNFEDRVTSFVGMTHGHQKFSLVDKYDGSDNVPGHGDECLDKITGSTEGIVLHQYLNKSSVPRFYRKSLCRVTPLYFEKEVYKYRTNAYKFSFPNTSYDRIDPSWLDCNKGDPVLLDGLSDLSKCFFDFPLVASYPHFVYGDPVVKTYVDGMKPNASLHSSYMYVEPLTGIPLESRARTQSNIVIRPLSGLHEMFDKFSDMAVPLFWVEYGQEGLPDYVIYLVYTVANILPIVTWVLSPLLLTFGAALIWWATRKPKRQGSMGFNMEKIES